MTPVDGDYRAQTKATERRITMALLCAACIVGFAWLTYIVLDSFPPEQRRIVETVAPECLIVAFAVLAVVAALRGRS